MKLVLYFVMFITFINLCVADEQKDVILTRIELCHFDLPEIVMRANATFNLVYSFEISDQGQPINIKMVNNLSANILKSGSILKLEQVESCITNWRLEGINTSKPVYLILSWKHGVGWVSFYIGTEGFNYSIIIPPGFNRYYGRGEYWQHDEGGPVDQHIHDVEKRTREQFEE